MRYSEGNYLGEGKSRAALDERMSGAFLFRIGEPRYASLFFSWSRQFEADVDDKEQISEQIRRLQGKYTLAVKAYGVVKNVYEREQAKALIAKLGKQIAELKKELHVFSASAR